MLQSGRIDVAHRRNKVGVNAADGELQALESTLSVQLLRRQGRIRVAKRRLIRHTQTEDRRRRLPSVEGGEDGARWVAAVLLLKIGERGPVVKDSGSALDQPL